MQNNYELKINNIKEVDNNIFIKIDCITEEKLCLFLNINLSINGYIDVKALLLYKKNDFNQHSNFEDNNLFLLTSSFLKKVNILDYLILKEQFKNFFDKNIVPILKKEVLITRLIFN